MINKILIINDEPSSVNLLNRCLNKAGFEVSIINSSKKFLEQILNIKPALVLLDVNMSEIDSFETRQRLKLNQATKDTPNY